MRVIINADDFGMTRSVNEAVFTLGRRGTVTSTTVMVNLPFADQAVDLLNIDGFGIGLHINLTQGPPISPPGEVPSLVGPDGEFLGKTNFERAVRRNAVNDREVFREINAQFNKLAELVGDRIDHLDSHQGVNKLPPVAAAVREVGRTQKRRIGLRVYNKVYLEGSLADPRLREPSIGTIASFGPRRVAVEIVWRRRARKLRSLFSTYDGLLLSRAHDTVRLLTDLSQAAFRNAPDRVFEIPCHPAIDLEGLPETKLTESRIDEFNVLNSAPLMDAADRGFRLVNYGSV